MKSKKTVESAYKTVLIILLAFIASMVFSTNFAAADDKQSDTEQTEAPGSYQQETGEEELTADELAMLETLSADFAGQKIAVLVGSIFDDYAEQYLPESEVVYFNSTADMATALDAGKIGGYIADEPMITLLCNSYPDQYIRAVFKKCSYAYIFPKVSERGDKIRAELDEYIRKIKADGTLDEIKDIWLGSDESRKVVDMSGFSGENGTIEFSMISAVGAPFTYIKDNQLVGYDVDIAARFCKEYGYNLHINDYNSSGFFSSVAVGKSDFGGASIVVTKERQEQMNFSEATYNGSIVLAAKKDLQESGGTDSDNKTNLAESFRKTFIKEDRWKLFISGIGITMLITLLSTAAGGLIGFALFLVYRKRNIVFNKIVDIISAILQMTPVVVILMIFYYLLFRQSNFSGAAVSVICFSLMFASSVIQMFDNSVKAIDKGQTEAVYALGYKDTAGFLRMILPQTIPFFAPEFKSGIVNLLKSTSIVGYIAVQDLTMVTDIVRSRTYEAFFPLIMTAAVYFAAAVILTKIIDSIEINIRPQNRKPKNIPKEVNRK